MLMEQTLEKMNQMKLSAMVEALEQQRRSNQYTDLGFEERLGLLVDEEWTAREHRKLTRRLRAAKLRDATASLENVDFKHRRRLDRSQVLALGSCGWIQDRHNLLITGPTGIGKSFLASAFVERACRQRCCIDRGGDGIRPFPSGSVRRYVRTQAVRVRSLCSGLSGRPGSP